MNSSHLDIYFASLPLHQVSKWNGHWNVYSWLCLSWICLVPGTALSVNRLPSIVRGFTFLVKWAVCYVNLCSVLLEHQLSFQLCV